MIFGLLTFLVVLFLLAGLIVREKIDLLDLFQLRVDVKNRYILWYEDEFEDCGNETKPDFGKSWERGSSSADIFCYDIMQKTNFIYNSKQECEKIKEKTGYLYTEDTECSIKRPEKLYDDSTRGR